MPLGLLAIYIHETNIEPALVLNMTGMLRQSRVAVISYYLLDAFITGYHIIDDRM